MDPERWKRLTRLFDLALDVPPGERAALLERECPDDADLRAEVARLLEAESHETDFIRAPIRSAAVDAEESLPPAPTPEIDRYRIVAEVGRGGMGTVYLADRADEAFRSQVAIKVVRRSMASPEALRRFRSERQILANLNHPGIARLLDGGATLDGRPYVAMEYVDGSPIDVYCDGRRLSTRLRLELFRKVCDAVQYAHRNLVVHRDLKPGNILVTEDGAPKLLDFGIAKLLVDEESGQPLQETGTQLRMMTPAYASPEQVRGDPVTTATDVYALGLILYELLSGHSPHRFEKHTPAEIERVVCEQMPGRPSTMVTRNEEVGSTGQGPSTVTPASVGEARGVVPERLKRILSGDLDTIVLTALRKEPERRYLSVEMFSEDVRRYLEGLPILARQDSMGYRTGKFVRRHRGGVTTAVATAAAVAGLIGFYTTRLASERDNAQIQARRAEEVANFMGGIFSVTALDAAGSTVTAKELLDAGAERIQTALLEQPDVRMDMLQRMAGAYQSLGFLEEAGGLLDQAIEIGRRPDGDPERFASLLTSAGSLAWDEGDYGAAESLYAEALEIRRRENPGTDLVAEGVNNLAKALQEQGRYEEAGAGFDEAIALYRAAGHEESGAITAGLLNQGQMAELRGDYEEAERLNRDAVRMDRALEERGQANNLLVSLHNLGAVLSTVGQLDEAEALLTEVIGLVRQRAGPESTKVAASLVLLADVAEREERYADAEGYLREALLLGDRTRGRQHPDAAYDLTDLANVVAKRGDLDAAEALFREAVEIANATLEEESPYRVRPLLGYGTLLVRRQRFREAEDAFRSSLAGARLTIPDEHPFVANVKYNLAIALLEQGQYDEAEALLDDAFAVHTEQFGADDPRTVSVAGRLAEVLRRTGRAAEAAALDPGR